MNMLSDYNIILGSKSPRRSELLRKAHIPFTNIIREVEELYPPELDAKNVPAFLAELKAGAFEGHLQDGDLVICADTIVIQDGKVIGKPKDRMAAMETLRQLSDQWHKVITGVCLKSSDRLSSFSVKSLVQFYPLTEQEIDFYIDEFQPFDKAGSYGIQDWIGINKIKKIKGSYTNIMGLPMGRLYHELINWKK